MTEVTKDDLARVFVTHFDRLQGVDYVFAVLLDHLHQRGLIDPAVLAAREAARTQSEDQALPAHLTTPPTGGAPEGPPRDPGAGGGNRSRLDAPDWLRGVIDGGKRGKP